MVYGLVLHDMSSFQPFNFVFRVTGSLGYIAIGKRQGTRIHGSQCPELSIAFQNGHLRFIQRDPSFDPIAVSSVGQNHEVNEHRPAHPVAANPHGFCPPEIDLVEPQLAPARDPQVVGPVLGGPSAAHFLQRFHDPAAPVRAPQLFDEMTVDS